MRRRQFIAGLGSAAAWPLLARAQQPKRVPRVAVLYLGAESDAANQSTVNAFRKGCKRRSKNPSLEATEWFGCAGVKIRQSESLCLIRARARDEARGTLREGTTCGSN